MRTGADRPYYSGKRERHGLNVQVLADPAGRLLCISPALPGTTDDLTAARTHGLMDGLPDAAVLGLAGAATRAPPAAPSTSRSAGLGTATPTRCAGDGCEGPWRSTGVWAVLGMAIPALA